MNDEIALRDAPITITTLERLIGTPTIPARYTSVGDMVATVLMGRELGIGEMTSLNELYLVGGTVSMSAKLMLALVFQAGHKMKFTLYQDKDGAWIKADCQAWRKTEDEYEDFGTFEFTMDDARTAGLADKDNWVQYPQWMMANRAMSAAARFAFPDVILAVGYVPEEVGVTGPPPATLPLELVEEAEVVDEDEPITEEEAADLLGAELMDGDT